MMIEYLSNLLKSDNSRTLIVKQNVLFSAGLKAISIIISLLLVPLTINYVSSELYGIWLTLSSIISWLSFFDVGFGLGLRNRLTTAIALGDFNKGKIYVSTTYCVLFIVFSVIGVIGYCFAGHINWCALLNISSTYSDVLVSASQIIIVTFCITIVLKLIQNVLQAYQMTALAAAIDTCSQLISLFFIFILTRTTFPKLTYLAFIFCCAPLIVYVLFSLVMYSGRFMQVAPSFKNIHFSFAKDLFSLGGQFFLIQIIAIVLYQSVNFIISHFCGPEQVTIYNVAYKYLNCSLMVFNIVMAPLWSAYNDAIAKDDYIWMKSSYKRLIRLNLLIVLMIAFMIVVSPIIYTIWVGQSIHIPFVVSILIGLYMMCVSISTLNASILNGMSIVKVQLIQALIQGIVFVGSIIIMNQKLNLTIILIIMLITAVIPAVILPVQVSLILGNKAKGIWKK